MHARLSHEFLLHERFRAVARDSVTRPAMRFRSVSGWQDWSYGELAGRSGQIAAELRARGVQPAEAVGVVAAREPDIIAAILAIVSVGAHYVPLDPHYPPCRLSLLCEDAGIRVIVTAGDAEPPAGIAEVVRTQTVPAQTPATDGSTSPGLTPEGPVYVMFTSGSTGAPKGVVVPHRAVARLVLDSDYIELGGRTVFLHVSPLSFDASTLEIWGPLLNGGLLVLYPEDLLPTPEALKSVIAETGVNCLWMTASLFNNVIDQDPQAFSGLEYLLTGGEALSVPHVARALAALPQVRLVNGYGPTENTTFTTCFRIPRDFPPDAESVPIGTAISGTRTLVVDEALRPVRQGEAGELLALGAGLALGYLNRPELTAEHFIEVRTSSGESARAYRTGDRVRQGTDGTLEFLGRFDDQVKIDGHRIEPGEIRRAIESAPGVRECRVVLRTGPAGQKRLAAYVLSDAECESGLREFLRERLPAYMVPHYFHRVDRWPTTANGKLDVSALPDPFGPAVQTAGAVPGTDFVRDAWAKTLGHLPAPDTNFFDAGGTSLEAMQLHELLQACWAQRLASTFVFEHATITSQLAALSAGEPPKPAEAGRGARRRAARPRRSHAG